MTPYSIVPGFRRFGEIWCLFHVSRTKDGKVKFFQKPCCPHAYIVL